MAPHPLRTWPAPQPDEDPLSADRMLAPCPLCQEPVEYWLDPIGPDHHLNTVTWCETCPWMGSATQLLQGDAWGVLVPR